MFGVVLASEAPNGAIVADRRLFLADDGQTLVEDGDVRARYLLCAPGHLISSVDAKRLALSVEGGRVAQPGAPADEEAKTLVPDENKLRAPGETKGAKKR